MSDSSPKKLLIGAHTSAAGGSFKALLHGQSIGASTIQLFTSNQKRWTGREISKEEVLQWEKIRKETQIDTVMCHDSYLINLGSPNKETLEKSRKAFSEELLRCHLLKIDYLNFHPGAYTSGTLEESLDTIVESLLLIKDDVKKGPTRLLLETTAGQGTSIGWRFEELGYIIKKTHNEIPIGVCIDTCHIFAAGYDIRTKAAWDKTLEEFDKHIGIEYLYAMHLNDSKYPLGARRDRHDQLGKGDIGIECFKVVMTHPKLKFIPKYLETPISEDWADEIQMLKDFAKGPTHVKHK